MDSARVSARNYDEALTKALIELGTTSDNVDVEIIFGSFRCKAMDS